MDVLTVFSDIFDNYYFDPVSNLGLLTFYIILISLPFSFFSGIYKNSPSLIRLLVITANFLSESEEILSEI